MQDFDDLKWAKEKYGWQSNQENMTVQKTINDATNAAKIANKAIEKASNAEPHIAAVKKAQEIAQKGIETIKGNIQRSKEQDERDRLTGEKTNNTGKYIYILCGVVISIFILTGGVLLPMISSVIFFSSPGFSTPAVLTQMKKDTQIVEVAKRELSDAENNIGGNKYKEWFGINGNWCAMFVSYCANECGYIGNEIMPKTASVMDMSKWYKERGLWRNAIEYTPKAGDIIFFQNDMSHVGIVIDYNPTKKIITTIEGNTGEVDTNIEHSHNWQLEICQLCEGDNIITTTEKCTSCGGNGCVTLPVQHNNKNYLSVLKIIGCQNCGGSGNQTIYVYTSGDIRYAGRYKNGNGKIEKNINCPVCYASGTNKGKTTNCTNPGCSMSSPAAWPDYPNGICYTSTIAYHEGSSVQEKKYPFIYAKISGYGLPEYPLVLKEN